MSFSPQQSRVGNAFAAGAGQQPADLQQGSVRIARDRLRAIQAVREQASMSERSPTSEDGLMQSKSPKSPRRLWEAPPYSPSSRQRTYEQDYNVEETAPGSSWPLSASKYNPADKAVSSRQKNRNSTLLSPNYPETFYDASSRELSPQALLPPQPTYGRSSDSYSPTSAYSPALAPSVPRRTGSMASNASGSIPDFPLPASQYQSGRRTQNFVPSGRSRRGVSSYYSQMSGPFGVSPIPEEANSRTTNSYASSNVIPSQMKDFYLEETPSDEDNDSTLDFDWEKDGEKVKESQLLRQASLGRRQKPALTTIRSGENLRAPAVLASTPTQVFGAKTTRMSHVASILDGESVLLDASSSEHDRRSAIGVDSSDPFNPGEPATGLGRLGSFRKAGDGGRADKRQNKMGHLADRIGSRRPPALDVQAVKEAEARASLTSLPDLIKRATRLAANLDKGRTASRLGVDWMLNGGEQPRGGFARHPSTGSSLSGMLRSFPPPVAMTRGVQTPSDPDTAEEMYKNLNVKRRKGSPKDTRGRRRQICGMSRRAFISVVLIVFFLVAAAVILPVFLILLPNKNKSNNNASVPVSSALQDCQKRNPCSNGGTVVINLDKSCGCVCTNGFTGAQCNTQSNDGCTTIAATGTKSASVGTQVPDLIKAAQEKFSIPLDATALSSAFAVNNMTCTTENAIITFPGDSNEKRALKRGSENDITNFDVGGGSGSIQQRTGGIVTAGASSVTLVVASSTATLATTTSSTIAAAAMSSATAAATGTSSSNLGTNSTVMQFAKIGILFVLQDSRDLSVAVSAQENLSQFLQASVKGGSSMQANNITLGSGYLIDLVDYFVTLRNSTQYGIGVNFNGTATGFSNDKRSSPTGALSRLFY
jgi:hypothetical protein